MQTQEGNFANIISDHKSDEENRRELIDDFNPDLEGENEVALAIGEERSWKIEFGDKLLPY